MTPEALDKWRKKRDIINFIFIILTAAVFFCLGIAIQSNPHCAPPPEAIANPTAYIDIMGRRWYLIQTQHVDGFEYATMVTLPPGYTYNPVTKILQQVSP